MRKTRLCLLLIALLLLCGCGAAQTEAAASAAVAKPPIAENGVAPKAAPPTFEPNTPGLGERLCGTYCAAGDSMDSGEAHVIRISYPCGLLLVEHNQLYDGSCYSYWAQELWPLEPGILESCDVNAVEAWDYTFSTMSMDGEYWDGTELAALELKADRLSLRQNTGGEISEKDFLPVEEVPDLFHNPPEYYADFLSGKRPEGLSGTWCASTEQWAAWLELSPDGGFRYLRKDMGRPILWLSGAWGEEAGTLCIMAEQFGGGKMPLDFYPAWSLTNGALSLHDEGGLFMGSDTELLFHPAGEGFVIPPELG